MPSKYQCVVATSTLLQAQYTALDGRMLLDPWQFGDGQPFSFTDMTPFTPFGVIGNDDLTKTTYGAYTDFGRQVIQSDWAMYTFIALGYGNIQIHTPEYYELKKTCFTWEDNLRTFFQNNSNLPDSNGAKTARNIGKDNGVWITIEHPRLRMYSKTWFWGVYAIVDIIQEND